MEKKYRQFNVVMYILMAAILGLFIVFGTQSGHPWALTCYQCRACNINCPLGYDVASYIAAASTNNPNLYMDASNLQLSLRESFNTDKNMIIEIDSTRMTAKDAVDSGYDLDTLVWARTLRAKDAAKFDPVCGNCESIMKDNKSSSPCPINLPITNVIRDLKDDGEFA